MDDLHGRFRRLDRVETPNLWNEAVARAVELELAPRRTFNAGMALIAVALLLAALVGTVAVGAWLDQDAPVDAVTYDNGMIAAANGCGGLIGIDTQSFEARQLVGGPDECEFGGLIPGPLSWSSDGSRLAYLSSAACGENCAAGPWVYEVATGESRKLADCPEPSCDGIAISPDGSLVAYLADPYALIDGSAGGTASLEVMNVDSGQTHRIDLPAQPGEPVFSPDGSQIALPVLGGTSGIYLVEVELQDGSLGNPTLLHGIVEAADLTWSPDGEWIAFTQTGGLGSLGSDDRAPFNQQITLSGTGIVIVHVDGTEARVLASGLAAEGPRKPTWSADSGSVAYLTEGPAGRPMIELWTVPIDGGEPTQIYESACCTEGFGSPAWSPDGEWIAFGVAVEGRPSESGAFLVRPDGSDLRHASNELFDPAWQPIPQD